MSSSNSRELPFKIAFLETDKATGILMASNGESPPSSAHVARLLPNDGLAAIVCGATSEQLTQLLDGAAIAKEIKTRARAQNDDGQPSDPVAVYWCHDSLARRFDSKSKDKIEQIKKDEKLVFDNHDKLEKGKLSPPPLATPTHSSAPLTRTTISPPVSTPASTTPAPASVPSAPTGNPSPLAALSTQYRLALFKMNDGLIENAIVLSDGEEENETATAATPAAAAPAPPAAVLPHHTPPHGTASGSTKAPKAPKKSRTDLEIVVLKVTITVNGVSSKAGTLEQMVDMHPLTEKKTVERFVEQDSHSLSSCTMAA